MMNEVLAHKMKKQYQEYYKLYMIGQEEPTEPKQVQGLASWEDTPLIPLSELPVAPITLTIIEGGKQA